MGNPFLSDDAVGVRLARALAPHLAGRPGLDVVEECSVGGLDLLDVLSGYQRVIVLDSLRTAGGKAGDWHHFTANALRGTVHLAGIHDVNLATVLELGRRLGVPLPEPQDIHFFAVEVEDDVTFSERMSDALEWSFPTCAAAIHGQVQALLDQGSATNAGAPDPARGQVPAG
jgi:hydrogenase maturation protease